MNNFCAVIVMVLTGTLAISSLALSADRESFYSMCEGVSEKDGLTPEQIVSFCGCMSDSAVADQTIYDELWEAGTTEPDRDARMAKVSDAAREVVLNCRN